MNMTPKVLKRPEPKFWERSLTVVMGLTTGSITFPPGT